MSHTSSEYTLKIEQDDDPMSPREWDNLGIMVCFHKRHDLGDETDLKSSMFDGWQELKDHLVEEEDACFVAPLYLMDHSGLSMSLGSFSCPWDSGQVGFIYTTPARMKHVGVTDGEVKAALASEVRVYDQYLQGDVWSYVIEDRDGDVVDSCCGFFGHEYAESEGRAALEWVAKDRIDKRPMTADEKTEYVRKLVQRCHDDSRFLAEVVEHFVEDDTYEDYLVACGSDEKEGKR